MTWILQVEKCKRINYQKFQIIAQLEQKLPAGVLSWESSIKPEADAKKTSAAAKAVFPITKRISRWSFAWQLP